MDRTKWFWGSLIAISVSLAYFLVLPNYFPYIGISLTLITFATVVMYAHNRPATHLWLYYLICVVLSIYISLRSNPLLLFVNIVTILFFGSLLVLRLAPKRDLAEVLLSPFMAITNIVLSRPILPWSSLISTIGIRRGNTGEHHIAGLGVAVILLFVTVPALAAANPIFAQWLSRLIPTWNEDVIIWLIRAAVAGFLILFIPILIHTGKSHIEKTTKSRMVMISWWIPQLIISVVLALFLFSQWQLYTLSTEGLTAVGISHSERTREIFGQLIWVALVTILLLWADRKPHYPLLSYLLLLEGLALTGFAFMSDLEYIRTFGLTQKRLWGMAMLVWLWFLYTLVIRKAPLWVMLSMTGLLLVGVNILNFDYLIAHTKPPSTGQVIDYAYISTLSHDTLIAKEHINILDERIQSASKTQFQDEYVFPFITYLGQAEYLQNKYSSYDIRAFNFGEYLSYLQIKDLKVDEYRKRYDEKWKEFDD